MKDFSPQAQAEAKKMGGRFLVVGGTPKQLKGEPPRGRIIVEQWDDMDQFMKYYNAPEQQRLFALQQKYSKVRAYAVEGVPTH